MSMPSTCSTSESSLIHKYNVSFVSLFSTLFGGYLFSSVLLSYISSNNFFFPNATSCIHPKHSVDNQNDFSIISFDHVWFQIIESFVNIHRIVCLQQQKIFFKLIKEKTVSLLCGQIQNFLNHDIRTESVINLVTNKISGYQNNIKTKKLGGKTNNKLAIRLLLQ